MSSAPELRVGYVDIKAARHACVSWHYSGTLPTGKLVKFGAWEDGRFLGVVLYGRGANKHLLVPYGLEQTEGGELVRIALRDHVTPVTQIVAATLRMLRATQPGLRLIVSFADPAQGHRGAIYQAGGWLYLGRSTAQGQLIVAGKPMHKRTASARYGTASPEVLRERLGVSVDYGPVEWKHVYVMPLDKPTRRRLNARALPYPATADGGATVNTPAVEGSEAS
jgi:hypothetical protein